MEILKQIVDRICIGCIRDSIEGVRNLLASDSELTDRLKFKSNMEEELNNVRVKEVAMKVITDTLITSYPGRVACELAEIAGVLHEKSPKEYNKFLVLIGAKSPDKEKESDEKEESKGTGKLDRFFQEAQKIELRPVRKKDLASLENTIDKLSFCIGQKNNKALVSLLRATAAIPMAYLTDKQYHSQVDLAVEMTDLYRRKNADYGNSFDKSLDKDGLIVADIRIGDKINRITSLLKKEAQVVDESLTDTLIDLANYCIMTILWIQDKEA